MESWSIRKHADATTAQRRREGCRDRRKENTVTRELIANIVERIVAQTLHDHGLDGEYFGIITQTSKFGDDLGMDDVDVIEVVNRAEQEFTIQIPDDRVTDQSRVTDLTEIISEMLQEKAQHDARAQSIKAAWVDFPCE